MHSRLLKLTSFIAKDGQTLYPLQGRIMKFSGLFTVVLVLLLPTSARSQSAPVTVKDLAGVWVKPHPTFGDAYGPQLIIGADSTFLWASMKEWGHRPRRLNYLRGDTISFAESESP